ncbi:T9SS C-terminal target domain-containing protein [Chryseobacterium phosphatilyticum]|uniref:T9SS C-terminal target domain-containing protein n=1 Tax=Chryseobacterium phosphatilyticum TaxID=475075 RepID=A0A316XCJ1_9FLAO|nr:T9SS type A sorting domain-containing protein [Chryseobacterium phosphatilyticum]PWN71264.1 T9SS C-terminal target domain-containing protein [Chryseobacterium phosphatilyticum]
MKKLNFSLFLVAGMLAHAQPSITRAAIDKINIPITFRAGDVAPTVTAGASGANATWDFSAYIVPNVSTSTTNECPGQSNCFRFPGANRITRPTLSDVYDFTLISDTEASMLGTYAVPGDMTMTYTDPLINFKFPATYLQQFTDTYQFSTGGAGSSTETGQVDYTVDAYGTITTPTGTYPNVLRIKRMRTATQTPGPFNYTNESYMWVSPSAGIVFNFAINTFTVSGTTNVTKSVSYPEAGSLSTTDLDTKKEQISVHPNPSADMITLTSKEDFKKITVTSMDGKAVIRTGNVKNIDISKLPKGVYILQGELKNGNTVSKKIIKQ